MTPTISVTYAVLAKLIRRAILLDERRLITGRSALIAIRLYRDVLSMKICCGRLGKARQASCSLLSRPGGYARSFALKPMASA